MDFFHFPGHKAEWCHKHTNPWDLKLKLQFSKLNTPAAEQAFNWINRYKSVKGMNEARFIFFFLYLLELHNLKIEDKVNFNISIFDQTQVGSEQIISWSTHHHYISLHVT